MIQPSVLETRHRYTIHGKIASGGMGTIRLGLQLVAGGFSRVVAIKQIHAMYANNQEFVAMFRDELRVASRVVHPNVVPILDVVSTDDELSLVMEYVHGLSVARLVTSTGHAPSPEIATAIMIGMLHGLHAAHEALSEKGDCLNIVHRDVTPHNVMVGVDGTPRVLDFGIAHALGRSRTTTVGQIKGKAKYLAPEQLGGGPVDRRADIYSASVVFWEMLTGRRLFRSAKDDAFIDLAARNSVESPHLIQPGISPHLSRIVLRGLRPDPEARYATALEMAVALEEGAAAVSATKVGQWVGRVWGHAGLARLQEIRAIEGGVGAPSVPDHEGRRGHDFEGTPLNRETEAPSEASEAQMTVPERPLGRSARASDAEETISYETEDSVFGPRRELPPFIRPRKREADGPRDETPPAVSPSPANEMIPPARAKGRVGTLATFLVALALAAALFVMRGAGLPAMRAPAATSQPPAADAPMPPPARISSIPVIEMATPPSPSPPAPEGGPASVDPSPRSAEEPAQPAPAKVAASVPSSDRRAAPPARRVSASIGRTKPRSASRIAGSQRSPRKSWRTESAGALEEASAAQPPAPAPPSCDPPFIIDDDGIKRFKLSCL